MNCLEQLAAGWYTYMGYFVRTNVRAKRLFICPSNDGLIE